MNARKLISLAIALLITSAGTYAMMSGFQHYSTATARPAHAIDGLSVVTLPAINVVATPLPPLVVRHKPSRSGANRSVATDDGSPFGLATHKTALNLTLPTLRMPYYSFGSTALQIGKD